MISKDRQGLTTGKLQINGLTDPTYKFTTHNRGSHSVGMGLDLGVQQYINRTNQIDSDDENGIVPSITGSGWSVSNGIAWANTLQTKTGNNQAGALRNFLSIYALTQKDGANTNGTWSGLPVINGDKVREALFGSGAQDAGGLIQNVWIGGTDNPNRTKGDKTQNPYSGINLVLGKLGFGASNPSYPHHGKQSDHHNHFHIDLRPPQRVVLDPPKNLLTEDIALDSAGTSPQTNTDDLEQIAIQALLDDARSELNLEAGEASMFFLDLPPVPPQSIAPAMIAQINLASKAPI